MKYFAEIDGVEREMTVGRRDGKIVVASEGEEYVIDVDRRKGNIRTAFIGDRKIEFGWQRREQEYTIIIDGVCHTVTVRDALQRRIDSVARTVTAGKKRADVRAPIPGLVSKILVTQGAAVKKGEPLLTLDAMKLENEILSPIDGRVLSIDVAERSPVEKNQLLAVIE